MHNLAKQARSASSDLDTAPMPQRLAGKRALITGVETALGQAIAHRFAREGAHVALLSSIGVPDTLRQSIQSAGRICVTIKGDMRELDVCDRALDEALTAFDGLDILVNNPPERDSTTVGGVPPLAFATLYLTRNALRVMEAGGAIINTAFDDTVPAFTRSLAQVAVKHSIRVNAVAPLPLPPLPAANQEMLPPSQRSAAVTEDTASSFVFLASRESAGLNGQLIDAIKTY
jgi:NAD(P)-dependent dehydrogenase (short-subunit alcohol dehydrogenase family)